MAEVYQQKTQTEMHWAAGSISDLRTNKQAIMTLESGITVRGSKVNANSCIISLL